MPKIEEVCTHQFYKMNKVTHTVYIYIFTGYTLMMHDNNCQREVFSSISYDCLYRINTSLKTCVLL